MDDLLDRLTGNFEDEEEEEQENEEIK